MRPSRFLLPALVLVSSALSAQTFTLQPEKPGKATLTHSTPLAEGAKVTVRNLNGGIQVEAWDRPEVAFTGEFRPSSRDEQVKVVFESGTDGLVIRGDYPKHEEDGYQGPACRMTLKVPRHSPVDVETVNGRVTVAGLAAGAACESTNGAIEAEDISGGLAVKTVNGALALVRIQGRLQAATTNGAVTGKALDGKGEGIEIRTVNGAVSLSKVTREGELLATAENGQIRVDTEGATEVKTTKHRVEAAFHGKGTILVSTVNGALNLD